MTLGLVAKNSKNAVDNKIRGLVWFGRLSCISCLYNAFEILTKNVNSVTFQIKFGHFGKGGNYQFDKHKAYLSFYSIIEITITIVIAHSPAPQQYHNAIFRRRQF